MTSAELKFGIRGGGNENCVPRGYSIFRDDLESVSLSLETDLRELRNANIFITGGTGFFGIWLVECLLWASEKFALNIRLTVLSRSPEAFLDNRGAHLKGRDNLFFVHGGILDFTFPDFSFTHIIHAATEPNLENSPDWAIRHIDSAIRGMSRLLDFADLHRPEALLITSSGAVYFDTDSIVGDECVEGPSSIADYTSERMVYGQCKRMVEILASASAERSGYRCLIARCFAFVGPYLSLNGNYAIGNFMQDVLLKRDIIVEGDGTPLRSFLYTSDLVVWLLRILVRGRSGVPYNVGGDEVISIKQLAQLVADVGGNVNRVVVKRPACKAVKPSAYIPSLLRSRSELGLGVTTNLRKAIRRTLAWHRYRI